MWFIFGIKDESVVWSTFIKVLKKLIFEIFVPDGSLPILVCTLSYPICSQARQYTSGNIVDWNVKSTCESPTENRCPSIVHIESPYSSGFTVDSSGMYDAKEPAVFSFVSSNI